MLRFLPIGLVLIWIVWLGGVLSHGFGLNLFGVELDFEEAAKFGDAFGSLSGLMASLAAAGAWYAVSLQQREIAASEIARRADEVIQNRRAFEQNFFQLLKHLADLVRHTDVVRPGMNNTLFSGTDAFKYLASQLRNWIYGRGEVIPNEEHISQRYDQFYSRHQQDLGHYFRTLYHICRYVNESSVQDKLIYVKITLAQLSDAELILLAYNCAFGGGGGRFVKLIAPYGPFSNFAFDVNLPGEREALERKLGKELFKNVEG